MVNSVRGKMQEHYFLSEKPSTYPSRDFLFEDINKPLERHYLFIYFRTFFVFSVLPTREQQENQTKKLILILTFQKTSFREITENIYVFHS
jgi:hypothetical protein